MFVHLAVASEDLKRLAALLIKDFRQNIHGLVPTCTYLLGSGQYQGVPPDKVVFNSPFKILVAIERIMFPATVHNDIPQDLSVLASLQPMLGKSFESCQSTNFFSHLETANNKLLHSRNVAADYKNVVSDFDCSAYVRNARPKRRRLAENRIV